MNQIQNQRHETHVPFQNIKYQIIREMLNIGLEGLSVKCLNRRSNTRIIEILNTGVKVHCDIQSLTPWKITGPH